MIYSIMNYLNFQGFEILHSTIVGLLKTFTTNIGTLSSLKSYQEHLLVLIFAKSEYQVENVACQWKTICTKTLVKWNKIALFETLTLLPDNCRLGDVKWYIGISKFLVRHRLYVYIVNELSLVADMLVEKLTSVVFTFLSYKEKWKWNHSGIE